jgi:hypothetical protein
VTVGAVGARELLEASGDTGEHSVEVVGQQRPAAGQKKGARGTDIWLPSLGERCPEPTAGTVSFDRVAESSPERERDHGLRIVLWTKRHPDSTAANAFPVVP